MLVFGDSFLYKPIFFNVLFQVSNLTEVHALHHVETKSLADLTTHTCVLLISMAFALLNIKTNNLAIEHVNQYPYYLYLYSLQFLAPSLVAFSFSIVQYLRNYPMRQTIWKECQNLIYCIE